MLFCAFDRKAVFWKKKIFRTICHTLSFVKDRHSTQVLRLLLFLFYALPFRALIFNIASVSKVTLRLVMFMLLQS